MDRKSLLQKYADQASAAKWRQAYLTFLDNLEDEKEEADLIAAANAETVGYFVDSPN